MRRVVGCGRKADRASAISHPLSRASSFVIRHSSFAHNPQPTTHNSPPAFTLLEILLAAAAAALVLIAVYGVFARAMHLRDDATARVRDTRQQARAERALRGDLGGALVSGGTLAAALTGGTNQNGPGGADLPGYLKLTSATGKLAGTGSGGDVQQVEYYLVRGPDAPSPGGGPAGGTLVRAVTRDLLASPAPTPAEEKLLTGVQSLQVQFYDGSTWQDTWQYAPAPAATPTPSPTPANKSAGGAASTGPGFTTGNATLPQAVRVDVQPAPARPGGNPPPPIEVLVSWTTQPFAPAAPTP